MLMMIVFSAPQAVRAQGIGRGDTLPAGTTLHGDGFFYGATVSIDGDVDGDVFAIGSEIKINGKISGSLVAIGEKVELNGNVDGTTYSAAIEFDLAPDVILSRNLYFAGASMNTQTGSLIHRDLFAAALGAQMMGSVQGQTKAIIGPAEFVYLIMRRINRSTGGLSTSNLSPAVLASYNGFWPAGATGEGMVITTLTGLEPTLKGTMEGAAIQPAASIDWPVVGDWLLERLRDLVRLFFFGLLGLWLMPHLFFGSARLLRSKPLPSTGWGQLGVVISFNLIGVVILLVVVTIAVGLFLGQATFWDVAWSFMAISGFSLSLTSKILALFVLYVSKAIVTYVAGHMIPERFIPAATRHVMFPLLIGTVIYVFLAAVPLLGWVIRLMATALGLGAAWLFYRNYRMRLSSSNVEGLSAAEAMPA